MDVPIESNKSAHVYKPAPFRRVVLLSIIVAIYAMVVPYCYMTAGEPRKAAALSAQELADKRWAVEAAKLAGNYTDIDTNASNDTSIITSTLSHTPTAGSTEGLSKRLEDVFDGNNSPSVQLEDTGIKEITPLKSSGSSSWFAGWFGPTKEQKRAKKELEAWQKQFNERSEEPLSLPPSYLPSAWACLALFSALTLHALFHLMCHWIVSFKALMYYSRATKVDAGCFLLVEPPENRGKSALVEIKRVGGVGSMQVEFQRQTYLYTPVDRIPAEDRKRFPNGVFTLSTCPVNLPLQHYLQHPGLKVADVERLLERWGKNHLAVHIPSFLELLQAQLLSPLAIFQIFCSLLWLLDEYWSYTLWTLLSVVVFEATTVFHRTRTQKMLGGMAAKPSPIFVLRAGQWVLQTTKDLLPGDIISLGYKKSNRKPEDPGTVQQKNAQGDAVVPQEKQYFATSFDDTVPCDCLLLRGSAVVNEASLTGESVPQMKEALSDGKEELSANGSVDEASASRLDMSGQHRVSVLFSGTSLLTVDAGAGVESSVSGCGCNVPCPPDKGAVAYVLRTGFSSSQGTLMQMIEFSQQTVAGNTREIGMALLVLFMFALAAAGYVLKEGLRKKEKTTHEILLKCVIIITSVVPRQFPMQTAVAVNMALMALVKVGIFCTEQYRVPLAGKVTHCLFDKTGTLTTDQLVPVGLVNVMSMNADSAPPLCEVSDALPHACMVLAACHSLVVVEQDGNSTSTGISNAANLAGDPIELASIKGVKWHWEADSSTARPGAWGVQAIALEIARRKAAEMRDTPPTQRPPNFDSILESIARQADEVEAQIEAAKQKATKCPFVSVKIITRHHFSSALQRMSVVAQCEMRAGAEKEAWFSLVKGSPEALLPLFCADAVPSWYTACYEQLARSGLRVLALGYRKITGEFASGLAAEQNRQWVEKDLQFCGFIAFQCKIRADSGVVVRALLESDHKVTMLTGDALLTSLHVAKEVSICSKKKSTMTLHAASKDKAAYWTKRDIDGSEMEVAFSLDKMAEIARTCDLLTTESDFLSVATLLDGESNQVSTKNTRDTEKSGKLWAFCGYFKVFARMSPQGKASIIRAIQQANADYHVLMCGDGGNDVGALKQADIGVALLAGHANANTTEDIDTESSGTAVAKTGASDSASPVSAEDALNAHEQALKKRGDELNALRVIHMKEFQARYQRESQIALQQSIKELTERGEYMKMFSLMKDQAITMKNAINNENVRFMATHGHVWDPKKDPDNAEGGKGAAGMGGIADLISGMENADQPGGVPMVRPGDASVAAPFTSRIPSVRAVVDLIRQGRCTLLSALMHQQIMMLESIIAAYTLSVLSLHNARSSERQMMASSWLIMTAAVAFSYSAPLDHMHPLRPIRSLFHPAIFVSMLGQAGKWGLCLLILKPSQSK